MASIRMNEKNIGNIKIWKVGSFHNKMEFPIVYVTNIINKNINDNLEDFLKEIENDKYIINTLFKVENKIYLDFFEFMDILDLKAFNETKNENENFYCKELFPLFIYNIFFSLYIFNTEKRRYNFYFK